MQVQDNRSAVEEDQAVRAMRKPGAEEAASGSEAEIENTQGGSSVGSAAEVVGGDEIARGEECEREEEVVVVAVVGKGNLIGREDIRGASDKTTVGVHGGQAPSEEFPEEGVCERVDCMKAGRGGHVETEAEVGSLGRHSRSGQADLESKRDNC